MKTIRQLNVFIASPGDVQEERGIIREVCEETRNDPFCKSKGVSLEASGWEDVFPEAGRPQETINRLVRECDLFVCILHKRFGAPTGKEESGTLEEFLLAYDSWKETRKPHIMFYFKEAVIRTLQESRDPQLLKVLELKDKIEKDKLLLYKSFDTQDLFRELFSSHVKYLAGGIGF